MIKTMKKNNISQIARHSLCVGCGTCVPLCPNGSIHLQIDKKNGIYVPIVNQNRCSNCGICLEICPGYEVNFIQLNEEIFGKQPEDQLIGNYIDCWSGYSIEHDIRYNCSSGGLVTQLLIEALESKMIDGVLITRMNKTRPLEPESFIAKTKEEIFEGRGSKYCPVPSNLALEEILNAQEGKKFAVVGLPCHIHGIRKAEKLNKKLKDRIVLHLGLFCSHVDNFNATRIFLGLDGNKDLDLSIKSLRYRSQGWPGKMEVVLKSGEKFYHNYLKYMEIMHKHNIFTPIRCNFCCDLTAELADIGFGDAWSPEFKFDTVGRSTIIIRNEIGYDLVRSCRSINMTKFDKKKVIDGQGVVFKKYHSHRKEQLNSGSMLIKVTPIEKIKKIKNRISFYIGKSGNTVLIKYYCILMSAIEKKIFK